MVTEFLLNSDLIKSAEVLFALNYLHTLISLGCFVTVVFHSIDSL